MNIKINMNSNKYFSVAIEVLAVLVILACFGGYFIYQKIRTMGAATGNQAATVVTEQKVAVAYNDIEHKLQYAQEDPSLVSALTAFREIAADTNNSPIVRARALNGINYAYTQSNFDAEDVQKVVFSTPPFSAYYTAPSQVTVDPLHPESGSEVAAVESALVKLNELSNSLIPNHYAISRMEVANIFAYQRDVAGETSTSTKQQIGQTYALKQKQLIAAYDALGGLGAEKSEYSLSMYIQIMFAHAGSVSFVGTTLEDKDYLARGEKEFNDVIALGDAYPRTSANAVAIRNQTLLARIFYISFYWKEYKVSNPQKMKDVIRPLTDLSVVQGTTVYKEYLPSHKDVKVPPFTVLRAMAKQMPELKTFLTGLGWVF